jgi:hypothetical protein
MSILLLFFFLLCVAPPASHSLTSEKCGLLPGQIYGPFGDPSGQQRHTPVKAERAQVYLSIYLSLYL